MINQFKLVVNRCDKKTIVTRVCCHGISFYLVWTHKSIYHVCKHEEDHHDLPPITLHLITAQLTVLAIFATLQIIITIIDTVLWKANMKTNMHTHTWELLKYLRDHEELCKLLSRKHKETILLINCCLMQVGGSWCFQGGSLWSW